MAQGNYKVAKRTIWYISATLIALVALFVAIICVALTSMHIGNVYIIATEGMALRANCILQAGNKLKLTEYFTQSFIEQDEKLSADTYQNYTVSNYDYRLEIEGISVSAWSNTATLRVVERVVSLSGSINSVPEGKSKEDYPPPEWAAGRYELKLTQEDGRWYISGFKLIEANPSEKPHATPDMSLLEEP